MLVANKIDLPNRVITPEQGQQLAHSYGLTYIETSAMNGTNINEMFYEIAKEIIKQKPQATMVGGGLAANSNAYGGAAS